MTFKERGCKTFEIKLLVESSVFKDELDGTEVSELGIVVEDGSGASGFLVERIRRLNFLSSFE